MIESIQLKKKNEALLYVSSSDAGLLRELSEYFTFFAEGYKWMPAYKNKIWDGKVRLFNYNNRTIPYGLLNEVLHFGETRGYKIELDNSISNRFIHDPEFLNTLKLSNNGNEIKPREYQVRAFDAAIKNQRAILLSPTGSGKSLIIYSMIRFFLSEEMTQKAIIIVPTTSLVEQLYKDFKDYSEFDESFSVEDDLHRLYSGKEKTFDQSVVITTWQSAINMTPAWFLQFGCVIGDEAHLFKAKSLDTIMNRLVNADLRIGTTGTITSGNVNELSLKSHFGSIHRIITTKELMDSDTLAQLKIHCLALKYDETTRKAFGKQTYADEISFLAQHENRNRFISNLALSLNGNSLILYTLVKKHGEPLFKQIRDRAKDGRKVFFVSGSVSVDDREKIRELVEKEKNAIIVASSQTFATGINIKNLTNVIFASPTKSQVRVLQSIGRVLRKGDDLVTNLYDIADDLSWKSRKNYTLKHAVERVHIYNKEKFKYKIHEIDI
jgi:superfamily II DNA or RNA helicase